MRAARSLADPWSERHGAPHRRRARHEMNLHDADVTLHHLDALQPILDATRA